MDACRSLDNMSGQIRWSLDLRWQRPNEPNGFYGLKDCITMAKADDPAFQVTPAPQILIPASEMGMHRAAWLSLHARLLAGCNTKSALASQQTLLEGLHGLRDWRLDRQHKIIPCTLAHLQDAGYVHLA